MQKIILPELGEGINEAVVSTWYFAEGDNIKKGDDIAELTTDKATFNVPSPASGVIKKIVCSEGETVKVGAILAELE